MDVSIKAADILNQIEDDLSPSDQLWVIEQLFKRIRTQLKVQDEPNIRESVHVSVEQSLNDHAEIWKQLA